MLALGVGQSFGQIGHRVVQCQEPHGQFRFLGLFLLVLSRPLLGSPLVFLHLIHLVERLYLAHPRLNHGVDVTLAAGKVACNIADEVEPLFAAVNIEHHARCQCPDARADGRNYRHGQLRPHGIDGLLHALRQLLRVQLRHLFPS